jgi:hypothetical protein
MPRERFEPTTAVFERAKRFHTLDRTTNVIGYSSDYFLFILLNISTVKKLERSLYSDWLRARLQRNQSSSPGRVKNFHFSISSRQALGIH